MKTAPALILVLICACGEPPTVPVSLFGPQPGVIVLGNEPIEITVPKEAVVGTPIVIRVTTWGGHCMRKGDTQTAVNGLAALVAPFDSTRIVEPDVACAAILASFHHTAEVTFGQTGRAYVIIRGREWPGNFLVERWFRVKVRG